MTLASIQAFGQGAPNKSVKNTPAKGKKQTDVNFEDELIKGDISKPDLFYVLQKKQFNFKRLIKLREDFLPEMRRTSEDLQRGGNAP